MLSFYVLTHFDLAAEAQPIAPMFVSVHDRRGLVGGSTVNLAVRGESESELLRFQVRWVSLDRGGRTLATREVLECGPGPTEIAVRRDATHAEIFVDGRESLLVPVERLGSVGAECQIVQLLSTTRLVVRVADINGLVVPGLIVRLTCSSPRRFADAPFSRTRIDRLVIEKETESAGSVSFSGLLQGDLVSVSVSRGANELAFGCTRLGAPGREREFLVALDSIWPPREQGFLVAGASAAALADGSIVLDRCEEVAPLCRVCHLASLRQPIVIPLLGETRAGVRLPAGVWWVGIHSPSSSRDADLLESQALHMRPVRVGPEIGPPIEVRYDPPEVVVGNVRATSGVERADVDVGATYVPCAGATFTRTDDVGRFRLPAWKHARAYVKAFGGPAMACSDQVPFVSGSRPLDLSLRSLTSVRVEQLETGGPVDISVVDRLSVGVTYRSWSEGNSHSFLLDPAGQYGVLARSGLSQVGFRDRIEIEALNGVCTLEPQTPPFPVLRLQNSGTEQVRVRVLAGGVLLARLTLGEFQCIDVNVPRGLLQVESDECGEWSTRGFDSREARRLEVTLGL